MARPVAVTENFEARRPSRPGAFDRVLGALQERAGHAPRPFVADVEELALRAAGANVELSPYMRSLLKI